MPTQMRGFFSGRSAALPSALLCALFGFHAATTPAWADGSSSIDQGDETALPLGSVRDIYLFSDHHRGPGRGDPREQFLKQEKHYVRLVKELIRRQDRRGRHAVMVPLGDIWDFKLETLAPKGEEWLEQGPRRDHSPTEALAQQKLRRIRQAHKASFKAEGLWRAAGHDIIVHDGNHDTELWFPGVQEDLFEHWGGAKPQGRVIFQHGPVMIGDMIAWHGHWQDPFNSVPRPLLPVWRDSDGMLRLRPSVGDLAIAELWNGLRDELPEGLAVRRLEDLRAWARVGVKALPELNRFFGQRLIEHFRELTGHAVANAADHRERVAALVTPERVALVNRNRTAQARAPLTKAEIEQAIEHLLDGTRSPGGFDHTKWSTVGSWLRRAVYKNLLAKPDIDMGPAFATAQHLGARVVVNGHTHVKQLQAKTDATGQMFVTANCGSPVTAGDPSKQFPFVHVTLDKRGFAKSARLAVWAPKEGKRGKIQTLTRARLPAPAVR
jgi:hypothetical protein